MQGRRGGVIFLTAIFISVTIIILVTLYRGLISMKGKIIHVSIIFFLILGLFGCNKKVEKEEEIAAAADIRTLTDMSGSKIQLENEITKVITAGYCFTPCAMAALGVKDLIIGTGGSISPITSETMATFLIPKVKALPDLGRGNKLNIEAAAALNPDILILERDGAGQGTGLAEYDKLLEKLDLFKETFPTVVLNNAACYHPPSMDTFYRELRLLGEVFEKQNRADEIINYIKNEVRVVEERTEDINEGERTKVLFMGLMGGIDSGKGAVAIALPDYDCGTLFPGTTKIENAYTEKNRGFLSTEQVLTIDPDVIILVRAPGGYNVSQIYEEDYYIGLRQLKAVKEKRVYSTGQFQLHRNLAGLEIGIEMLIEAKAAYPERFKDVNVDKMLTEHYKEIYGLHQEQINELKTMMGLKWMEETGF